MHIFTVYFINRCAVGEMGPMKTRPPIHLPLTLSPLHKGERYMVSEFPWLKQATDAALFIITIIIVIRLRVDRGCSRGGARCTWLLT